MGFDYAKILDQIEKGLVEDHPKTVGLFRGRTGKRLTGNTAEKSENRQMLKLVILVTIVSLLVVLAVAGLAILYLHFHHFRVRIDLNNIRNYVNTGPKG